jgi:hypothetical protein
MSKKRGSNVLGGEEPDIGLFLIIERDDMYE